SGVFRARDTRLRRDVAVRRVELRSGPGGAARERSSVLAEARASARVTSSHAVDIFDLVEEQDALWLVMELVPRPSLARVVSEEGPLDDAGAARVGLAVLDVLEAARADGIVHGDLTPANVLVGE